MIETLLEGDGRETIVLSERTVLGATQWLVLEDESDTSHHNGCVLVAPAGTRGTRVRFDAPAGGAILVNPLVAVDPVDGALRPAPDALDGGGARLLGRHTVYRQHLERGLGPPLGSPDRELYHLAEALHEPAAIAALSVMCGFALTK